MLSLNPVLAAVAMAVPEAAPSVQSTVAPMPATAAHCHGEATKQQPQGHSCCKHGLCICSLGVAAPLTLPEHSPVRAVAEPELSAPSLFETAAVPRLLRPPIL